MYALTEFTKFKSNYFYELPEDIQTLIYKETFKHSLNIIRDKREAMDNFNKLQAYIIERDQIDNNKNHAIWRIIMQTDVGDPYYKYFAYYADYKTDFLQLNKTNMIRYDAVYSTIKYIDYTIYPIHDKIPLESYNYIKNILEQYVHIFLSIRHNTEKANNTDNEEEKEYSNIKGVLLLNNKIRVEYLDTYTFNCYIDIYNNILESYNFLVKILNILTMFNNDIYPEYDENIMNDLRVIRDWFEYNLYFCAFKINEDGDAIKPEFYS
jgi:hypothetical protein